MPVLTARLFSGRIPTSVLTTPFTLTPAPPRRRRPTGSWPDLPRVTTQLRTLRLQNWRAIELRRPTRVL